MEQASQASTTGALSKANSQHMQLREDQRSSKVNDKKIKNGGGGQEGSH
jgi:hypothetical protein